MVGSGECHYWFGNEGIPDEVECFQGIVRYRTGFEVGALSSQAVQGLRNETLEIAIIERRIKENLELERLIKLQWEMEAVGLAERKPRTASNSEPTPEQWTPVQSKPRQFFPWLTLCGKWRDFSELFGKSRGKIFD